MKKRYIALASGTLLFLCILGSVASGPESNIPPTDPAFSQKIERTKIALMKEKQIKDVLYTPSNVVAWSIGVIDDGSVRNGYASYVCEVLHQHGVTNDNTIVRVVDIVAVSKGKPASKGTSLGSMNCTTYKPFD